MSYLCINRYRPIIGRLFDADYRPADNRPLPYRCISTGKFSNSTTARTICPQDIMLTTSKCTVAHIRTKIRWERLQTP